MTQPRSENFANRLLGWYDRSRRDLPWRSAKGSDTAPAPYRVLVSELMLQQTQVATVIPYFHRFIERFPSFSALASADEQEVLRLWQGLGYYARARSLHAAARIVVDRLNNKLPESVIELMKLPGIGRYTAGAIASIAFGCRSPILDGNVMRVLCRLDRIESDPRDAKTQAKLWQRAEAIMPARRCGEFNSALMELGAMICTPRNPRCPLCPVREHCRAFAAGLQEQIPPPRKAKPTPLLKRKVLCIQRGARFCADRYLIEQRPAKGRWAGMWQFITIDGTTPVAQLSSTLGFPIKDIHKIARLAHTLTHRRYVFDVYRCRTSHRGNIAPRRWAALQDLSAVPLPGPHVRIAQLIEKLTHEP